MRRWRSHAFAANGYVLPTRDAEDTPSTAPLAYATRFIGGNPTGMHHAWCKTFVNFVMRRTGMFFNHSLRAIDALGMGPHVAYPQPGDLAVMRHHVTIVAAVGPGSIIGLGGNQGHRVKFSHYPRRRIIAFVRPQRIFLEINQNHHQDKKVRRRS
ncbi:MAG: hypothetical protein WCA63_00790 [Gallionella sp.]